MDLCVFDCDGTLYDDRLARRQFLGLVNDYVSQLITIEPGNVDQLLSRLRDKWGTTSVLRAVCLECSVSFDHAVEQTYLKLDLNQCGVALSNRAVRLGLERLAVPKVILTNSPALHAERILKHLGLANCFTRIIDIVDTNWRGKPDDSAYDQVGMLFPSAKQIFLCDDHIANLDPAHKRGWMTAWLAHDPTEISTKHVVISSLVELFKLPSFR